METDTLRESDWQALRQELILEGKFELVEAIETLIANRRQEEATEILKNLAAGAWPDS